MVVNTNTADNQNPVTNFGNLSTAIEKNITNNHKLVTQHIRKHLPTVKMINNGINNIAQQSYFQTAYPLTKNLSEIKTTLLRPLMEMDPSPNPRTLVHPFSHSPFRYVHDIVEASPNSLLHNYIFCTSSPKSISVLITSVVRTI